MAGIHLSISCKPLPLFQKTSLKLRELSDFNELICIHLIMNEFYYVLVILSKSGNFFFIG